MKLSEVSIRRPVLATIMTLVVVLFGVLSFTRLSVRQYPDITAPVVSVRTVYPGASARLVETDVTTVLEESLSGIESVKTFSSISREEVSGITLEFELGRDLDAAANDVRDRVFAVRRSLPLTIEEPVITKASADAQALVWMSLFSDRYNELELTDYAEREIKDRLASIPGVAQVWVWGARRYAMRIWLDADRLSSRQLTVQDVEASLRAQNVAIPSGRIESDRLEFSVRTRGELDTPEQFNRLIITARNGYPIRLEDVGFAEIGAEDDRKLVRLNGVPTVSIGVVKQSKANALAVARAVKAAFAELQPTIPDGMQLKIASDNSRYIERAIDEVYVAMAIALVLVVLVIFLFLGSARATLIPAVAIPASIIGAFIFMYAFGYTINILTLLGLVLAIGLVVDDAIVMLENIHRRIERGEPALKAAVEGSREIGFAVLATTVSLVAVFVPLLFLRGPTIRLFAEMAVAVAASVLISGFIALTLTPMMSARWLRPASAGRRVPVPAGVRRAARGLLDGYRRLLQRLVHAGPGVLAASLGLLVLGGVLFLALPSELAPLEDSGAFMVSMIAPEGATIRYTDHYVRQLEALFADVPEIKAYLTWVATGTRPTRVTRAGTWVTLTEWDQRSRSQQEIVAALAPKMQQIAGIEAVPIHPPAFEQAGTKPPLQLILRAGSYEELERVAGQAVERIKAYPGVRNVRSDLEMNKPELDVHVHRNKAADLGVSVADIGRTLETLLGGRVVTTFTRDGREHPVLVKIHDRDRATPADIGVLYVRGDEGQLVQLSNLVDVEETVVPTELNHYDKMRSATITAGVADGYALGDALAEVERIVQEVLPAGVRITYGGESKELKQASGALWATFVLAFLVVYLVLAAQFESFVHPLTILLSVPPAVTGALIVLFVLGGSLNLYSEIGLIMLLGLVTKNAILIVDVANQRRAAGMDAAEAAVEAALLRLRPIAMTTLATVLGARRREWIASVMPPRPPSRRRTRPPPSAGRSHDTARRRSRRTYRHHGHLPAPPADSATEGRRTTLEP
ncbi:efflux RND transporter permease subunit [Candidatus Nitrospira bockiana]